MSPRKPAVLRDRDGENLREHLIATAARLIDQRGGTGLSVRDIARHAQVADGALYNYFADKEDLLAHALLAHVGRVMTEAPQLLPPAGTGTVAGNLAAFIDRGLAVLIRVVPAFAGLLSQPRVLISFHAMVGGDAAFGTGSPGGSAAGGSASGSAAGGSASESAAGGSASESAAGGSASESAAGGSPEGAVGEGAPGGDEHPRSLPDVLAHYLRAEQRLGRIDAAADVDAATQLIVGAIHGLVLPRVLVTPGQPISPPPGAGDRLAAAAMGGLAPR
jgi:AcrR family transcriptional regulator